jgi:hypothetical protein
VVFVTAMSGWGEQRFHGKTLMGMLYHHQGFFPGSLVLKYKEPLKLSPIQEQGVNKLLVEYRAYFVNHISELKLMELELAKNVKSSRLNRKNVIRLIREIGKKRTDGVIRYSKYLLDIKEILTPEQQTFLTGKKRETMASRVRKRHKKK